MKVVLLEAVAAYDSALAEPAPDGEAAVAHSNAAQAKWGGVAGYRGAQARAVCKREFLILTILAPRRFRALRGSLVGFFECFSLPLAEKLPCAFASGVAEAGRCRGR